jgi:amino acid permease
VIVVRNQYCVGAGILALPHATRRGGLLFSPIVIGVIAAWNWVASVLLMECKAATASILWPAHLSSNYSRVAYAGAGHIGVALTDFSIIVTLLGVCIAFQITFATLLGAVPGSSTITHCRGAPSSYLPTTNFATLQVFPYRLQHSLSLAGSLCTP